MHTFGPAWAAGCCRRARLCPSRACHLAASQQIKNVKNKCGGERVWGMSAACCITHGVLLLPWKGSAQLRLYPRTSYRHSCTGSIYGRPMFFGIAASISCRHAPASPCCHFVTLDTGTSFLQIQQQRRGRLDKPCAEPVCTGRIAQE